MPIIRRLLHIGKSSKGVIIPKGWLRYFENKHDCKIEEVTIEVNQELRILPVLQRESGE
jgi:hypothetical protein